MAGPEREEILRQFDKDGFYIFRNVLDQDLVAEANEHVKWLTNRYPDLRPEHFHHPLIRNDAFWVRLVTDERILDLAEVFLGSSLACFTAHYICKPPRDGQPVLWHQDGAYWDLEPMAALGVWLAVDASTTENGCLQMIPGSHRLPIQPPSLRNDKPNMLSSEVSASIVQEWLDKAGTVPVELQPGDISVHHPNILHWSAENRSDKRRCGLDMGFIATSTAIANEGLYLDPLLVRGEPVEGVNDYRPFPRYVPGETIPFRGCEEWNKRVDSWNSKGGFADRSGDEATPIEMTQRMMTRLREGTVRRSN